MSSDYDYTRYHDRREAGVCPRCGKNTPDFPAVYCRPCLDLLKRYKQSRAAAARQARDLAKLAELKKKYPVKRTRKKKHKRKEVRR